MWLQNIDIQKEMYELKEDQLEYWDRKDQEIDDRIEWAEAELEIIDLMHEIFDLQNEISTYSIQFYAG